MSELSADTSTTEDGRLVHEPEYVAYLRANAYLIEGINESHTVDSSGRDLSHLVVNIKTYDEPRDRYDAVEDEIDLWVCSCEDFRYNQSADVGEDMVRPSECGNCKHILQVSMAEKAKNDDQQETL